MANNAPNNNSDQGEYEDYMSDSFLYPSADVCPGISRSYNQLRQKKINARKYEIIERNRLTPKRADIEKELLESGLAKPVGEESKGFSLLTKMGYKPGMSLGKRKDGMEEGIKIPLPIAIKISRTGLGHDALEDEKRKERIELHLRNAMEKSKNQETLLNEFQRRKYDRHKLKHVFIDLNNSRKACQDLDLRKGLCLPKVAYFWPIELIDNEEEDKDEHQSDDVPSQKLYRYSNGKKVYLEKEIDELLTEECFECLENITKYLRDEYCYCTWCGIEFNSLDELNNDCPGERRSDHDSID